MQSPGSRVQHSQTSGPGAWLVRSVERVKRHAPPSSPDMSYKAYTGEPVCARSTRDRDGSGEVIESAESYGLLCCACCANTSANAHVVLVVKLSLIWAVHMVEMDRKKRWATCSSTMVSKYNSTERQPRDSSFACLTQSDWMHSMALVSSHYSNLQAKHLHQYQYHYHLLQFTRMDGRSDRERVPCILALARFSLPQSPRPNAF